MEAKKTIYLALGFLFTGIGFVGAFLPILPTTPFLLLAAFFFSRGSEKWHAWLLSRPGFGPAIRDWEAHGVIRKRAKILATTFMVISFSLLWILVKAPIWGKLGMVSVGGTVLLFIWTRPSQPLE